jgi:hypothetical protein
MPLDIPASAAELIGSELEFVEPLLPAADSDDWQGILRQIFETEGGLWQRRGSSGSAALARG